MNVEKSGDQAIRAAKAAVEMWNLNNPVGTAVVWTANRARAVHVNRTTSSIAYLDDTDTPRVCLLGCVDPVELADVAAHTPEVLAVAILWVDGSNGQVMHVGVHLDGGPHGKPTDWHPVELRRVTGTTFERARKPLAQWLDTCAEMAWARRLGLWQSL